MKIEIEYRDGIADCGDCGMYEWEELRVFKDGVEVVHRCGDSHLGGNMMSYESPHALLKWAYEAIGCDVEVIFSGDSSR